MTTTRRGWRNMHEGGRIDLRDIDAAELEGLIAAFVSTNKSDRWKTRIAGWAADPEFSSVALLRRVLMLLVEELDHFDAILIRNHAFANSASPDP